MVVCMSEVVCENVLANVAINAVKLCVAHQDTEFAIMYGTLY